VSERELEQVGINDNRKPLGEIRYRRLMNRHEALPHSGLPMNRD
jgi:hypothetical protein